MREAACLLGASGINSVLALTIRILSLSKDDPLTIFILRLSKDDYFFVILSVDEVWFFGCASSGVIEP